MNWEDLERALVWMTIHAALGAAADERITLRDVASVIDEFQSRWPDT